MPKMGKYFLAALAVTAAIAAEPKNSLEPDAGTWHTWIVPDVKAYRVAEPPDHGRLPTHVGPVG
jgi:hypothetical protein